MNQIKIKEITKYVEENIGSFHQKRIDNINKLKLKQVLKRKNPYLFKAKYILTVEELVKGLVEAYISSSEEGIFGDWLEGLAIFINEKVFGGWKSGIEGVDLEFNNDDIRYIVDIKSGPNWGNSSQIKRMINNFQKATKTLRTSNSKLHIIPVNGCCYGKDNKPDKQGIYYKYCGQRFWEFISGDENLYTDIIEPLGYKAKERNEEFMISYARMINTFNKIFSADFCTDKGDINWEKLVKFNSAK
ncbi:MAG: cytosolic protein [Candidatus Cloacimonetes bacterium]|nr:cytosolic protein [Candidatus Cloacimonadota bacterium]